MTNPEMTKNTSTPTYPPLIPGMEAWKQNYQQNGDGAETLNVRAKCPIAGRRA